MSSSCMSWHTWLYTYMCKHILACACPWVQSAGGTGVCSQCWLECFIRGCWEGAPFLFLYASCLHICVENSGQVCADGVESVLCRYMTLFRKSTLCVDGSVSCVRLQLGVGWVCADSIKCVMCMFMYLHRKSNLSVCWRCLMWAGCVHVSEEGSTSGGCSWRWWYWSPGWTSLLPRLLGVRLQFPCTFMTSFSPYLSISDQEPGIS